MTHFAIPWKVVLISVLAAATGDAEGQCSFPGKDVITTSIPQQMLGWRATSVTALGFDGTSFAEVPIQIDERNRRDEYVLPEGLPYTAYDEDGSLDENDQISFRPEDMAGQINKADLAKFMPLQGQLVQAELCGRYLYFQQKHAPPLPSDVTYDSSAQRIETAVYRYHFRKDHPALIGKVTLKEQGDLELLSWSRFHMDFRLPWYLPDFSLTSENFTSEVESWKRGPLRTIVAVGLKYRGFLNLVNLHLFTELVFTRSSFSVPTVLQVPIDMDDILKPGSGVAYVLRLGVGDAKVTIDTNLPDLPVKPIAASELHQPAAKGFYYGKAIGPWGIMGLETRIARSEARALPRAYFFGPDAWGDQDRAESWPFLADRPGDFGVFVDISGVSKGTYQFSLDLDLNFKANESLPMRHRSPQIMWSSIPRTKSE